MSNLRINFPSMPIVRRQLDMTRRLILAETRVLIVRLANKALERVKALTPIDTGETREKWRLFVINKKGPSGKAQGAFFFAIDHPYNRTGAKRTDIDDDGKRKTTIVNDGTRSLLTDLEFGTKAHIIKAKAALAVRGRGRKRPGLRFKIGAKWITTQEVKHPGTRAYSMTTIAAAEAQRDANIGLREILNNATRLIEGIK